MLSWRYKLYNFSKHTSESFNYCIAIFSDDCIYALVSANVIPMNKSTKLLCEMAKLIENETPVSTENSQSSDTLKSFVYSGSIVVYSGLWTRRSLHGSNPELVPCNIL